MRGQNIINGPLPFLFGMPPEKAKLRYQFTLLKENKQKVMLAVKPRWQQDAANWREAKVILDKNNRYLPEAVQLIDPTGNLETVYTFGRLIVDKTQIIFRDPFNPHLFRYKLVTKAPPAGPAKKPLVRRDPGD